MSINSLQKQTEAMLNRLSRVNQEILTPEELTRYEELVSNAEIQLQNINIIRNVETEQRKNAVIQKKIEASNITATEIQKLISEQDPNTDQKISRGVKYIQNVIQDAGVIESGADLTNLSQVVSDANQYLSTL
jgi:hypothetical protein